MVPSFHSSSTSTSSSPSTLNFVFLIGSASQHLELTLVSKQGWKQQQEPLLLVVLGWDSGRSHLGEIQAHNA